MTTLAISCALMQHGIAQEKTPEKYAAHNKGKFFINWGGNREAYSKSDIRFWGNGYDFTLNNVRAHDKPKGMHVDYIDPLRMTIPQTNLRIGYYFTDKYNISIGVDHMKYVMTQNQVAEMTGSISGHSPYNGQYQNHPMVLTEEFLKFEHTDGLNYINTELTRMDDVTHFLGWDIDKIQLNTVLGAGVGLLYPKTNTTLMGLERHDQFHVAGYGADIKTGLNVTFFKHYFIQTEIKGGYINMPDIRTTFSEDDHASQHFNFVQWNLVVGGIFRV
ncbi:Outermembrane protein [Flavobacterium longum]